jgi:hypothetical protein
MSRAIYQLIAYGFYPAWLIAGAFDYWCHRRSSIESTSGVVESLYHVAQLATMAIIVLGIALFAGSLTAFAIVVAAGLCHTVLSYLDVRFTDQRRYISPLEQHVHAVLDIVPLASIALWIVLEWPNASGTWRLQWRTPMLSGLQLAAIFISVFVVAGAPVLEELWRTARAAGRMRKSGDHIGLATIK